MLFNSIEFLIFLPIVFLLYWFVCNKKLTWQNILLLTASYFFYGWWSWKFMGLLALSTFLDYGYGFGVASNNRRKAKLFLWLSVINNLGILAVFKYYNFFAEQFSVGLQLLGMEYNALFLDIILPVGISFYTFHGMSYVFDIYRGSQRPISSFVDYAVFVSFFPLLVAGPIERASHLLPQVQKARSFNYTQAINGCKLILWGMFKKVVIADNLAPIVNTIFSDYESLDAVSLIIGAIAFSFQIYGDFSGYSDIALGIAKLFGFELLSNFRYPYFSRDIAEFWRRWHISLSSWFRDYLYIPLGGSREGKSKAVRNTFIIFIVSGFWHGASWNFIVWGFIHACGFLPLLILNRNRLHVTDIVASNSRFPSFKELRMMVITFGFVTFAWIFFRAPDLQVGVKYVSKIVSGIFLDPASLLIMPKGKLAFGYIILVLVVDWVLRRNERELDGIKFLSKPLRIGIYYIALYYVFLNFGKEGASFIYFQF